MRDLKKLIIFVGAPGSGKSTLTDKIIEEFNGYGVSTDRIKEAIFRKDIDSNKLGLLFEFQYFIIEKLMKTGHLIVSDASSSKEWQREKLREIAKSAGYSTGIIYLYSDINVLKYRLNRRATTNQINNKAIDFLEESLVEIEIPNDALIINTKLKVEDCMNKIKEWIYD